MTIEDQKTLHTMMQRRDNALACITNLEIVVSDLRSEVLDERGAKARILQMWKDESTILQKQLQESQDKLFAERQKVIDLNLEKQDLERRVESIRLHNTACLGQVQEANDDRKKTEFECKRLKELNKMLRREVKSHREAVARGHKIQESKKEKKRKLTPLEEGIREQLRAATST